MSMSIVERQIFDVLDEREPTLQSRGYQATEITYLLKEVHPVREARSLAIGGLRFSRGMSAAYDHVIWAESHITANGGLELWAIRARQINTGLASVKAKSKKVMGARDNAEMERQKVMLASNLKHFDMDLWDLYIKLKNALLKKIVAGAATSKHGMIAAQKIIDAINKTQTNVTIGKDSRPNTEYVEASLARR